MAAEEHHEMTAEELRDAWEQLWGVELRQEHKQSFLRHAQVERILTFSREEILDALPEAKKLSRVESALWQNQAERTRKKISKSENCPACGYAEKNCNC